MILTLADLAGKLAREYLRVSADKKGTLESPAEQHDENASHASRLGLRLGEPYSEPAAVSAARWSGKSRAEFERLVADLNSGAFGALVLIMWASSRGGRAVKDWVRLVDACERAEVLIYVTSHARMYDPANARDRRSLLEDAVDAEYDNAKRRDDVVRNVAARAAKGEPHGRVPYGYRRAYDPISRALLRQERHPDEAPKVVELFDRLKAGDTFKAITADWAARGITTRGSKRFPPRPFAHTDLLKMARNPTYAGLRIRTPKGEKRAPSDLSGAVEAKWPALIDDEVFHAVQGILADPGRLTHRPGRARHLLSMIARCGVCGGPMTPGYRNGIRYYKCRAGGHVGIDADDLDAAVEREMKGYLSRESTARALAPSPESAPERAQARKELGEARASLRAWRDKAAQGGVSPESWEVIEPGLLSVIARLQERDRELSAPAELGDWVGTAEEVAARWEGATLVVRRELVRRLLSPPYMGWLAVMQSPGGNGGIPVEWRARLLKKPLPGPGKAVPAAPRDAETAWELRRAACAGVTLARYRELLDRGLLHCLGCREFHPAAEFGRNRSLPGGRPTSCLRSLRERRALLEAQGRPVAMALHGTA